MSLPSNLRTGMTAQIPGARGFKKFPAESKRYPFATLRIVVNIPGKACQTNVRSHWAAKAKAIAKSRADAADGTQRSLGAYAPPKWVGVRVHVAWYARTARVMDEANIVAAIKGVQDGIADALGIDDRFFESPTVSQHKDADRPRVEITLSEIEL